jgi:hypothetical protein
LGYFSLRTVLSQNRNKEIMKNLAKISVLAFAAISFTFASCNTKTAEKAEDATESTVDAADAELDSVGMATEGDTATVKDQPVKDGVVDSMKAK